MFFQRVRLVRRCQQVTAVDPFFGAQVFQVDPDGSDFSLGHDFDLTWRKFARERLNNNIGSIDRGKIGSPVTDFHSFQILHVDICQN